jgi:hypothetical protein
MRFSPVIQFGHISGFMPTDFSTKPYALQTDIVGTSGSSGSPIIDLETGKVIGIAQQVITSGVIFETTSIKEDGTPKKTWSIGNSKLGLVYGVYTGSFPTLPDDMKNAIDTGAELMIRFDSGNLREIGTRKSP